jgi:peptidoglycan/xylan/chitin deacetylase (PgdA/CDA1 family)
MLKRLLVLAVFLALFVTVFIVRFHIVDSKIDQDFRAEREKFHVEGLALTTATPPTHETLVPSAPPPLPSAAVPVPSADTPGAAPATSTPTDAPLDTNSLIGPLPPGSSNSPDTTPAPATNTSPDSTLIYPGLRQLPFALMASYITGGMRIQSPTDTTAVPAVPASVTDAPPVAPAPARVPAPVPAAAPDLTTGTNSLIIPAPAPVGHPGVASSVIILGYHQFNPPGVRSKNVYNMPQDVFEAEMKYLHDNGFHVVPLSDVVRFAKGEIGLPPKSVAITIDDGYKSSIVYAGPVLKQYGFPWTFFIYPAFITVHESKGAASWNDLIELQKEGVDIECHSMTHPFLAKRFGKTPEQYDAWLTTETAGAKAILEQHLAKTIKYFAYPYGDYNKTVEAKVIGAGFEAIFTVAGNPIHYGTNVYNMGRYVITTPVEKSFEAYLHQGALGFADIQPAPGATVTDPRPIISGVLVYSGTIRADSLVTQVLGMGEVRHDFDPKSATLRLYLPRDLINPVVDVNIHAKDATTGQTMAASWRFNYQATAAGVAHAPIGGAPVATPAAPAAPTAAAVESNAAPASVSAPAESSNATPIPAAPAEQTAPASVSNAAPTSTTTP